jgi:hypothetical protein
MKSANQNPNSKELIKAIVAAYVIVAFVAFIILLLKFKL